MTNLNMAVRLDALNFMDILVRGFRAFFRVQDILGEGDDALEGLVHYGARGCCFMEQRKPAWISKTRRGQ